MEYTVQRSIRENTTQSHGKVKLNKRGKFVVWSVITAFVMTGAFIFIPQATAQSEPAQLISYTVQPNDTLWDFASDVTPAGADIYDTMAQIKKINHLDSDQLTAGQTLLVPQE